MVSFNSVALLSVIGAQLVTAHFVVNAPAPLGNNIENEDTAPCGGFTPSNSETRTDFHVGGDAIAITTLHAQSFLAYRGMLGSSLSSPNWTVLIPTLEQFGLNNFCEPSIAVPSSWAGQSGLLQIIQDAEDGVHYQCMAVNFVSGVGGLNSKCTNSSGISATFMADSGLDAAEGAQPSASSAAASSAAASSAAAPSSSSSAAASPSPTKSSASQVAKLDVSTAILLLVGLVSFFI